MRATNCDKSAETGVATRTKERPLTIADRSMKNIRKRERERETQLIITSTIKTNGQTFG